MNGENKVHLAERSIPEKRLEFEAGEEPLKGLETAQTDASANAP